MIRVVMFFALFLTCCSRLSAAGEPTEPDAANGPHDSLAPLPDGWRWDRPVSDHAERQGDAIQLRTEAARIWAGEGNENRIITEEPIGDAARAFVEIELVNAVGKWEQCGLLVYQHDDSFVKLVVEHIDGKHYVVMAIEADNNRKVLAKIEIADSRAQLSLQMNGSHVSGFWRSNSSQPWGSASETDLRRETTRHFAVFSQDGDPGNPRFALVRGLRYTP
jgi:hypothetical protein